MSHSARFSALSACLLAPGLVQATGFRLPDQDAAATARGEAFVATADNPSAIYYNPAGITQLEGHQVRGGLYGLNLDVSYQSPAGGKSYENRKDLHAIPQLFYTYSSDKQPISAGLGIYSPYGLSSEWPEETGFRSIATKGRLTYYTIHPVIAWRVNSQFSIAAGPTFNVADIDLRQGLLPITGAGDGFRFSGDGWDPGYTVGALWKPHPKIQIGVSYRSETTVNFDGTTELRSPLGNLDRPASTEFPFPRNVVAGISFRPTPDWNFEFDIDWTEWSRLGTVVIRQASVPGLPTDQPLPLNWESSFYYEFGVTRQLPNGWSVSGGYIFNENSVPDANYTPLVADLDRHFLSVGVGHRGQHLDVDVAYQFGYGPTRTVSGSATSLAGQSADGRYEFLSHALMVTLGWRF